jgi:hypothetical protein
MHCGWLAHNPEDREKLMNNLQLGPQIGVAVIGCGRIGSLRASLS